MDSDTDAAPDPDTDDPDLRARVAELEASVAQQQETITKMLPGRRGVLKGAALLGGGALVGAGTADRASAQAAGQIGTASDPVDVEAYDLAVQNQLSSNLDAGGNDITNLGSVKTDDATITDSINYPVSVPSDKSSNRSFGTWEQNTTGAPLMITVVAEASASATQIRMDLSINTSQNVNLADNVSVTGDTGTRVSVQGVVADQNYYQVRNFGDTADYSILFWYEYNNGA